MLVGDRARRGVGPWWQPMAGGELGSTGANAGIGFVADVLADRMVIWSSRRDSQTVEGGTYLREHDLGELGAPEAAEHFVWSGREVAPRRDGGATHGGDARAVRVYRRGSAGGSVGPRRDFSDAG